MKKTNNKTKSRIVSAAWQLFYRNGFDNTTIDDIVELSQTSKGSFYHYFKSKETLMSSLAYLFDEKYIELEEAMDSSMDPIEKLIFLNRELFLMIENTVPVSLIAQLFSAQLLTKDQRALLDQERVYFKLVRQIVIDGKEQGLFDEAFSVSDVVRAYAFFERAMMFDWCIASGSYSLCQYSQEMLPLFMSSMQKKGE